MTGAVVIAGLKYVGPPAAGVVTNFLNRVFSPAGGAIGDALEHPIREWQRRRVERAQSVMTEAAELLDGVGVEPRPVPGRLLMPLLERASLEEDDTLHARWVALLAKAASHPDGVTPAFVSVLGELSPRDAAALSRLYRWEPKSAPPTFDGREGYQAYDGSRTFGDTIERSSLASLMEWVDVSDWKAMAVLIANLERLHLAKLVIEQTKDSERLWLETTDFGATFAEACGLLVPPSD